MRAPSSGIRLQTALASRTGCSRVPPYVAATTGPAPARQAGDHAVDGLGREVRPVAEDDDRGLGLLVERVQAAAQRSARPALPVATVDGRRARLDLVRTEDDEHAVDGAGRTRSSTGSSRSACLGDPNRVAAPAASTIAHVPVPGTETEV